jgi:hypothetical protein
MPLRRRLLGSGTAIFDAAGEATARVGPDVYGDINIISRVNISTTSVAATTGTLYLNLVSPTAQLDTSASANSDTSDTSNIDLGTTEKLVFRWRGGTPGAIATITLYGIAER